MMKLRVAFLGNHTVGLTALRALSEVADVVAVVAHPEDPEDGVRYDSVYAWAHETGLRIVRGRGNDTQVASLLEEVRPDLLWVTDYRYLLPASVLRIAPRGAVNLHPSLLPKYRGRAPLNWAILRGETEVGLSAHVIDEGMDSGDLLAQVQIPVHADDDIGTVLEKLLPHYDALPRRILADMTAGTLVRTPQNHDDSTEFRRRTPDDGRLNWEQSAIELHNLVRAVTAPYPGAFAYRDAERIMVWRTALTEVVPPAGTEPGTVFALQGGEPLVACGSISQPQALVLLHCTAPDGQIIQGTWQLGEVLR
ncbi:MAG: methionyl-tRNA formyltransferase [Gemmatimonadaceae bacterium]|nr:methionyl-tRNA formyltransferase [Gemmatimonadaceae bacterium]